MKILHVVWGAMSIALAFWINHAMAPRVARERAPEELTTATGKLVLHHGAATRELPLITLRPVVQDIVYPFGKRIEVRELALRSVSKQPEPELELFVDLSATGTSAASRDIAPWVHKKLPIVPAAYGGVPKSRVQVAGRAAPLGVVEGALTLQRIRSLGESESGMQRWNVRGTFELTLLDQGDIQQASGSLEAEVSW